MNFVQSTPYKLTISSLFWFKCKHLFYWLDMFVSHFENKIKEANVIKVDGSQQFKAQKYQEAKVLYIKAYQLLQPYLFYGATEQQAIKSTQLRATLAFNIGLCEFNQRKWRQAEQRLTQCITIDPQYMKAICKRAQTREERGDIEGAMTDAKQVYEFNRENRDFAKTYERVSNKYNEQFKTEQLKSQKQIDIQQSSTKNTSKMVPSKEVKEGGEKEKENKKGSAKWWILGLASLAGIALYQHFKNSKK